MPELSTAERERLQDRQFAYIDADGERHLPINDPAHIRIAIARFGQTDFESKAARMLARRRIMAAAERYGIEVDRESEVAGVGA